MALIGHKLNSNWLINYVNRIPYLSALDDLIDDFEQVIDRLLSVNKVSSFYNSHEQLKNILLVHII